MVSHCSRHATTGHTAHAILLQVVRPGVGKTRFQTITGHQNTESWVNMAALNYQDNSSATSMPTSKNDSPILWALGIKQYNWINNIVIPQKKDD